MFSTTVSVLLGLIGVSLLLHRVGMWAVFRYLGRRPQIDLEQPLPPLSLLKPIKGLEDELEQNLRSFYEQDYPAPLQIVLASTEPSDPGIAIARSVAAAYPHVATEIVVSRPDFGLNPKVSNIHGALLRARHDLVMQSDANVRLPPGYLRNVVGQMQAEGAALIGSIVVGVGERSPAAVLENLQLTAFTAPGLCMATELAGITCVLGKSMFFRRSDLEEVGGLGRVKDVLAEDYVLCQLYEQHGKRLALSTTTVANVNIDTTLTQFVSRHARWLKMRAVVSAPGYAADLGSNPLPLSLLAWLVSGFDVRIAWVVLFAYLYKCRWDAKLLQRLRGHGLGLAQLWATPARDLILAGIWCYALFSRSTQWRGRKLRLGRGSVLLPDDGPLPQRLLRRFGLLRG
ncbi:MAG: glycosyltransferase [Polyangiales bacterium]